MLLSYACLPNHLDISRPGYRDDSDVVFTIVVNNLKEYTVFQLLLSAKILACSLASQEQQN